MIQQRDPFVVLISIDVIVSLKKTKTNLFTETMMSIKNKTANSLSLSLNIFLTSWVGSLNVCNKVITTYHSWIFSIKFWGPVIFSLIFFPKSFLPVLAWKTIEKNMKNFPRSLNMMLNIRLLTLRQTDVQRFRHFKWTWTKIWRKFGRGFTGFSWRCSPSFAANKY